MLLPKHHKKAASTNSSIKNGALNDFNDLICFSHLRWNFVYQRPQHLLSRAAKTWRVWYIEEPIWGDTTGLSIRSITPQLTVVVPQLLHGTSPEEAINQQRILVDQLISEKNITDFGLWYYTPMALLFSDHLRPRLTVFDCMDELSAFLGAPPMLLEQERRLMNQADIVFTGGYQFIRSQATAAPKRICFPELH